MKTLYVSDLDGTLLDSSISLPATAVEALNRAIDCGALFTVATARTPGTLYKLLRNLHLQLPAIVMTGAALWHRDSDTYSDTCLFSADNVREIRDAYDRNSLSYFIYTLRHNLIEIYHQGPLSDIERDFIAARARNPYKRFLCDREGFSDIPEHLDDAILFFAMQPSDISHPAYADLQRIPHVNPMFYNDANYPEIAMIETFPENASKAQAVSRMARQLGADRIVVFGDNLNDLPMFEIADLAVAVSNAIPEVKAKADLIIGHHDDSAVATFILDDYLSHSSPSASPLIEF